MASLPSNCKNVAPTQWLENLERWIELRGCKWTKVIIVDENFYNDFINEGTTMILPFCLRLSMENIHLKLWMLHVICQPQCFHLKLCCVLVEFFQLQSCLRTTSRPVQLSGTNYASDWRKFFLNRQKITGNCNDDMIVDELRFVRIAWFGASAIDALVLSQAEVIGMEKSLLSSRVIGSKFDLNSVDWNMPFEMRNECSLQIHVVDRTKIVNELEFWKNKAFYWKISTQTAFLGLYLILLMNTFVIDKILKSNVLTTVLKWPIVADTLNSKVILVLNTWYHLVIVLAGRRVHNLCGKLCSCVTC
jgi:hypothetical protein